MQSLDLAQQIKILKDQNLVSHITRASSEPYNPEKPTLFDSEITKETIYINKVINQLLGIITWLLKELMMSKIRFTQDTWSRMVQIRKTIIESKSSITGR